MSDRGLSKPSISHSGRLLIVPISKAFQYYCDLESYPTRYPDCCKQFDLLDTNDNKVKTRELWNIALNNDVDHVVLHVLYTFSPQTNIQYEIMESSYEGLVGIKSGISLTERENYQTAIDYNNVLLDTICYPPHSKSLHRYDELIDYFRIKDCIYLENKPLESFKEGRVLPNALRVIYRLHEQRKFIK